MVGVGGAGFSGEAALGLGVQGSATRTRSPAWGARRGIAFVLAVVVAGVLVVALPVPRVAVTPRGIARTGRLQPRSGLGALPGSARATVSAAIGGTDPAYRVHGTAAGNPAQRFALRFGPAGVVVRSGEARLSLALAAVGRVGALRAVPLAVPRASGNRVSYVRGAVSEWYANGPLGLEQGFALPRRPAGRGLLTLAVRVDGPAQPRLEGSAVVFGRTGLSYRGLRVTDAHGRVVPAWLSLNRGRVLIQVDDARAIYPLRIDPMVQQQKLAASGTHQEFGERVAISADGNTALVGSALDNLTYGTAWFFTRSGSSWTQQQVLGPPDSGEDGFGAAVALSSDGSTALISGPNDSGFGVGAVWVFTRSGSTWTVQQMIPAPEASDFGSDVSLSADGNTALIGGAGDSSSVGAAWVFTRSSTTWTQQQKLTATAGTETGSAGFGGSVSLSADGNTALIGGSGDSSGTGAAWAFARSGMTWTQQQKLILPGDAVSGADPVEFGGSVALSGDGSTALIGGVGDNSLVGAAWVFARSGSTWTEQKKLTATSGTETGTGEFGDSVALSSSGNTAIVGVPRDMSGGVFVGSAGVFSRSGTTWTQQQKLTPASGTEIGAGEFGFSTGLSSDASTALVGAPNDSSSAGAVYAFTGPPESSGGGGGGGGGGGATTTKTSSFGDQSITLTIPAACVAAGGRLPLTLNSKSVAHKKPKLKFKLAQFFIDKGRKHTERVKKTHKVNGKTVVVKKHGKPVFVKKTVYLPNATARHVAITEALSIAGLAPGTHTLRVKLSYTKTIRKHGKRHTRIVTKTLKVTFTIC